MRVVLQNHYFTYEYCSVVFPTPKFGLLRLVLEFQRFRSFWGQVWGGAVLESLASSPSKRVSEALWGLEFSGLESGLFGFKGFEFRRRV